MMRVYRGVFITECISVWCGKYIIAVFLAFYKVMGEMVS